MKTKLISLLLMLFLFAYFMSLTACQDASNDEWKNDMYLVLVNKTYHIGDNYAPDNLVVVDKRYTTGNKYLELEQTAAEAVMSMMDAMRSDGITDISITSGFRTYAYQKMLFENYCAEVKADNPSWTDEKVKEHAQKKSAYPGTSEHHTGLCVDFVTDEMAYWIDLYNYGYESTSAPYDKGFAETAAFEWLQDNAHKFGFILRYPEDKTDITGYSYESWHYRFVGIAAATEIHNRGITLEEYLGK